MDREDFTERENVRVKVLFPVRWKICSASGDLADLIKCHRTSDRFCAPPPSFADLPADLTDLTDFQETSPHIYKMWMTMERKLDHVIWLLGKESYDDPEMNDGTMVNISASGGALRTDSQLEVGAFVHIRMAPPTFPTFLVEVICKVASSEKEGEEENRWMSRLEYTAINEADKEDLITYIFKRQREILRQESSP